MAAVFLFEDAEFDKQDFSSFAWAPVSSVLNSCCEVCSLEIRFSRAPHLIVLAAIAAPCEFAEFICSMCLSLERKISAQAQNFGSNVNRTLWGADRLVL